mgnify:CR=1 FL=1
MPCGGCSRSNIFFADQDAEEAPDLPGFEKVDNQLGHDIYENQYFVPMGFAYDYYIDDTAFETCTESNAPTC